ncbi:hypothetical protein ACLB2K_021001 [Fragaria x ananassa]
MDYPAVLVFRSCASMIHSGASLMQALSKSLQQIFVHQTELKEAGATRQTITSDLSMPMFTKIAQYKAGIIPVKYPRVSCYKRGGVKFELNGNPYWITALVYNVGGVSEVTAVIIKGSNSGWLQMSRNWGQVWQTGGSLVGQSLSFQVTTSDDKTIECDNVAPGNWQFRQTYEGRVNF